MLWGKILAYPSALCALFYVFSTIIYASRSQQKEMTIAFLVVFSLAYFGAFLSFLVFTSPSLLPWRKLPLGITCVLLQILFFASPIALIRQIIQSRDSSSVYIPLAIATIVNCVLWSVYGIVLGGFLVNIGDYFLAGPNMAATLLGLVQIGLVGVFPRKAKAILEGQSTAVP